MIPFRKEQDLSSGTKVPYLPWKIEGSVCEPMGKDRGGKGRVKEE
jgi:hypothetical protein